MLTIPLLASALFLSTWLIVRVHVRRRAEAGRWRVVTRTLDDGSRRVMLAGPDGGERVIRELPATLDGQALEAELREARSSAFGEALRLNDPRPARPAPAGRTRS
ncbi:MAG TPA: hypothetical protein VF549_10695 [Solirubrobacteraceae bacterium]|jgi:hypothetical protein